MFRSFLRILGDDNEDHTTSIYQRRKRSAYGDIHEDLSYSENRYILKWWSGEHDRLLSTKIEEYQWVWSFFITDAIVAVTPRDIVETWKREDPLCSTYAWYNVLMYFARSRATRLGLTKAIRRPVWKRCPLCGHKFVEDSLPVPLILRLGIDQLDYCAPCLASCITQNSGNALLSKQQVLRYLRDLADVLQRVPPQGFGEGIGDLVDLNAKERLALLKVFKRKPTTKRIRELFGSWVVSLTGVVGKIEPARE